MRGFFWSLLTSCGECSLLTEKLSFCTRPEEDFFNALSVACAKKRITLIVKAKNKKIMPSCFIDKTLEEILNNIQEALDVIWEIKDNQIIIKEREKRLFFLRVPYVFDMNSKDSKLIDTLGKNLNLNSNDKTISSNSDNTNTSKSTIKNREDLWDNIEKILSLILEKEKGEVFTIDKKSGIISIICFEEKYISTKKYIEEICDIFNKQIFIECKVLEVKLSKNKTKGIDWDRLLKRTGEAITRRVVEGNVAIVKGLVDMTEIIKFLDTQGQTNNVANLVITTANNEPSNIKIAKKISFPLQIKPKINAKGVVTEFSYDMREVEEGFLLFVWAVDLGNQAIKMFITPTIKKLVNMGGGDSNNNFIVEENEIKSTVITRFGEVIILGGLRSQKIVSVRKKSGFLNSLLGYKDKVEEEWEIVILIRATKG